MGHLSQDLRFAFRTFRKSPVFVAVAVLSLALGIGANTAIFTLVDQVLLRLLPVKDPQQLVLLWGRGPHTMAAITDSVQALVPDVRGFSRPQQRLQRSFLPVDYRDER